MRELTIRQYTPAERWVDGIVHAVGITASLAGACVLIIMAAGGLPAMSVVSLAIYSFALVAVFCVSAAYHLTLLVPAKAVLGRFDRATIYVKIASTYTPFALVKLTGIAGLGLFSAVWAAAAFGIVVKLFFPDRLGSFSYALYLIQGWAAVLVAGPLFAVLSWLSAILLVIGGLLYTVGVFFHLWEKLPYHNAIWHAFVLCGASCHFVAVLDSVVLA